MIDGQTNDSDFIGRCPTNVERPINCYFLVKKIFIFSKEVGIKNAERIAVAWRKTSFSQFCSQFQCICF